MSSSKSDRKRLRKEMAQTVNEQARVATTTHYVFKPSLTPSLLANSIVSSARQVNVNLEVKVDGEVCSFSPCDCDNPDIRATLRPIRVRSSLLEMFDAMDDLCGVKHLFLGATTVVAVEAKIGIHPANLVIFWAVITALSDDPEIAYAHPDEQVIDLLSEWLTGSITTDFFDPKQDNNPDFLKALEDFPQLRSNSA